MATKTFNGVKLNVAFTQAADHTQITSGSNIADMLGQISKWRADFNDVVWTGDADTVNGLTVETAVPANAVFTDTTYDIATASKAGLVLSGGDVTVGTDGKMSVSALADKLDTSLKGAVNGLAELDENGQVPAAQLPSYVDDVIEGYLYNGKFYKEAAHTTEIPGEAGKIYVDLATLNTYRWSGSAFVEISKSLALGTTSSTAFRGDQGKTAYDHSQVTSGNPHNVTAAEVGLGNVDNKSSETIRSEITSTNVTDALGFTPADASVMADTTQAGLMTADMVTKLNGVATGAEVNQNAFSNVKVGSTTIAATGKTDTVELAAGTNITLTPDASGKKVTITAAMFSLEPATTSKLGGVIVGSNLTVTADGTLTAKTLTGATAAANGTAGYVPAPTKDGFTEYTTQNNQFLCGDGTWSTAPVIANDALVLNCVASDQ